MGNGTGSGHTEVHIMTRASDYQEFSLHTGMGLEETDYETWRFRVGPNRNIYGIKTKDTGAKMTEIHIMTAASGYQDFSLQDSTALNETDGETDNVEFLVNQRSGDIVYLAKDHTGSNSTEVHVMPPHSRPFPSRLGLVCMRQTSTGTLRSHLRTIKLRPSSSRAPTPASSSTTSLPTLEEGDLAIISRIEFTILVRAE